MFIWLLLKCWSYKKNIECYVTRIGQYSIFQASYSWPSNNFVYKVLISIASNINSLIHTCVSHYSVYWPPPCLVHVYQCTLFCILTSSMSHTCVSVYTILYTDLLHVSYMCFSVHYSVYWPPPCLIHVFQCTLFCILTSIHVYQCTLFCILTSSMSHTCVSVYTILYTDTSPPPRWGRVWGWDGLSYREAHCPTTGAPPHWHCVLWEREWRETTRKGEAENLRNMALV